MTVTPPGRVAVSAGISHGPGGTPDAERESATQEECRCADCDEARYVAAIREISENAQSITKALTDLSDVSKVQDASARQTETLVQFEKAKSKVEDRSRAIENRFDEVDRVFQDAPGCREQVSNEVVRVRNGWKDAALEWKGVDNEYAKLKAKATSASLQSGEADALLKAGDRMKDGLHTVMLWSADITFPIRVRQHLEERSVGRAFDFHKDFADELPEKKDRDQILDYLQDDPNALNAVIDLKTGMIIRASPPDKRKWAGVALLAIVVSTPILLGAWQLFLPWNYAATVYIVQTYVAVAAGAIGHVLIDALKEWRKDAQSPIAIDDWITWLNIKQGANVASAAVVIGVFIGLIIYTVTGAKVDKDLIGFGAAVAVGYSADSLFDVFVKRFETATSKTTDEVKKKIAGG